VTKRYERPEVFDYQDELRTLKARLKVSILQHVSSRDGGMVRGQIHDKILLDHSYRGGHMVSPNPQNIGECLEELVKAGELRYYATIFGWNYTLPSALDQLGKIE
jgi:hypothetical protein